MDMQYATLGRTGLRISRIGFGGAAFGDLYTMVDQSEADRCVRMALEEYGINFVDTSPSYGAGARGEAVLGQAIRGGLRDKLILATKCGDYYRDNTPESYYVDYSGAEIRRRLEEQLKRLGTDHVDLLQIHDVCPQVVNQILEDTLPTMEALRREGKTRFLGITSIDLPVLRQLLEASDAIDAVLTFARYNLMDTSLVGYFDKLQAEKGFGLMNCSVLFMGLITKAAIEGKTKVSHWFQNSYPSHLDTLRKASELCESRGTTLADLAVQFGCDCPYCDSTLVSMGRISRLRQNMELLSKPYDRALAEEVRAMFSGHSLIPDDWES